MQAEKLSHIVRGLKRVTELWLRTPHAVGTDHLLRIEKISRLSPEAPELVGELQVLAGWLRTVGGNGSTPVLRAHLKLARQVETALVNEQKR